MTTSAQRRSSTSDLCQTVMYVMQFCIPNGKTLSGNVNCFFIKQEVHTALIISSQRSDNISSRGSPQLSRVRADGIVLPLKLSEAV